MGMFDLVAGASVFAVLFLCVVAVLVVRGLLNPKRRDSSLQVLAFVFGYIMLAFLGLFVYAVRVSQ
jgi:hypothetical protein